MKVLILSFSNNKVNEYSFVPNKIGLTFSCVKECEEQLKHDNNDVENICMNTKKYKKCIF